MYDIQGRLEFISIFHWQKHKLPSTVEAEESLCTQSPNAQKRLQELWASVTKQKIRMADVNQQWNTQGPNSGSGGFHSAS